MEGTLSAVAVLRAADKVPGSWVPTITDGVSTTPDGVHSRITQKILFPLGEFYPTPNQAIYCLCRWLGCTGFMFQGPIGPQSCSPQFLSGAGDQTQALVHASRQVYYH